MLTAPPNPPAKPSTAAAASQSIRLLCTRHIKAFLQPHGLRISSSAHDHLDGFLHSLLACLAQVQEKAASAAGQQSTWSTLLVMGEEVLPEIVPWMREWQDRLLAVPADTDRMGRRGLVELSVDQLAAASGLQLSPTPCQALICALDDLVAWILSAAVRLIRAGGAIKRSTIRRADIKVILEKGPMFRKLTGRLMTEAESDGLFLVSGPLIPLPDPCVTTSIETADSIPEPPTTDPAVSAADPSREHIRRLEDEIAVLRGIIAKLAQL